MTVNFLRTQIMKKSEISVRARYCYVIQFLFCKILKFNPYRPEISRKVTLAELILNAIVTRDNGARTLSRLSHAQVGVPS